MMEYLLDHKNEKWHVELSPGGVLISTVYTLSPAKIEMAMDFLAGMLDNIDADLLRGQWLSPAIRRLACLDPS